MSIGMNRVFLMGHIGNEPELRRAGHSQVMNLRVATTSRYRDRNDQYQERTDWHNVSVWGRRAEQLVMLLSKGDLIVVEGALRTHSYEKNGVKCYMTDVRASDVRFGNNQHKPPVTPQSTEQVAIGAVVQPSGPPPLPIALKKKRRRNVEQRAAA